MSQPTFPNIGVSASERAAGVVLHKDDDGALERARGVVYQKVKDEVSISLTQLQELRKTIQAFANGAGGSIGQCGAMAEPAAEILDLLLANAGMRFEHNTFMELDQVIDREHGEVVPKGHRWDPKQGKAVKK